MNITFNHLQQCLRCFLKTDQWSLTSSWVQDIKQRYKSTALSLLILQMVAWSFSIHADAPKQDFRVLFVGDSLTAAYKLPTRAGWVSLLYQDLHPDFERLTFINQSVSGITTAGAKPVLDAGLKEHDPHIVVIGLGANDGLQGKPVPYIQSNLARMIEQVQSENRLVVLLGMRLPPNRGKRYTEPFFNQYQALADKYSTYHVTFLLDGVAGQAEFMMNDGLHPNAKGQEVISQNLYPVFKSIIASQH